MTNISDNANVALITGASRGIGAGIAERFAKAGMNLVLVALDSTAKLREIEIHCRKFGVQVKIYRGDVSNKEFCEFIYKDLCDNGIKPNILVNCAGIIRRSNFREMSFDDWDDVIKVNLYSAYYLTQLFIEWMVNCRYGKIINITSQMAFMVHPNASPSYEVSKAGLHAFTRHLANKYAKFGLNINSIAPGSINTDMPKSMTFDAREILRKSIPLQRLGEIEEVSNLAYFLVSKESEYITGTVMHINGGSYMG